MEFRCVVTVIRFDTAQNSPRIQSAFSRFVDVARLLSGLHGLADGRFAVLYFVLSGVSLLT